MAKEPPRFSKSQLADLFGVSRTTVTDKLRHVKPCGKDKRNQPVYTCAKVAPHLVDACKVQIIPKGFTQEDDGPIDPTLLPPDLFDKYWAGKLKEQEFLRRDGIYWETNDVVDALTGVIKPLAFALRSLTDAVEKRAGLTPKQTDAVREVVDATQKDMHRAVLEYANGLPQDQ